MEPGDVSFRAPFARSASDRVICIPLAFFHPVLYGQGVRGEMVACAACNNGGDDSGEMVITTVTTRVINVGIVTFYENTV